MSQTKNAVSTLLSALSVLVVGGGGLCASALISLPSPAVSAAPRSRRAAAARSSRRGGNAPRFGMAKASTASARSDAA